MWRNRVLYLILLFLSLDFAYFYGGAVPFTLLKVALLLAVESFAHAFFIFTRFKFIQHFEHESKRNVYEDTHDEKSSTFNSEKHALGFNSIYANNGGAVILLDHQKKRTQSGILNSAISVNKLVIKGDDVRFSFTIANEDLVIYPYIKLVFFSRDSLYSSDAQTKTFSLLPREKASFDFILKCKYRGTYEIGIESVEVRDLFGLFKFKRKMNSKKTITVYPRIIYLENFNISPNFISESDRLLNIYGHDSSSISDIRKYSYGDSMKKIHWKLSAKSNELMVRNFQSTSGMNTVLVLDLKSLNGTIDENIEIEDRLIESATSVIYYCLENSIPINLVFQDGEDVTSLEARNISDFYPIYSKLANIRFHPESDASGILDAYIRECSFRTGIVLFTYNIDYSLYDKIYQLKLAGYDITLIYISKGDIPGLDTSSADEIVSKLPEIYVDTYVIDISGDIKSVLERK